LEELRALRHSIDNDRCQTVEERCAAECERKKAEQERKLAEKERGKVEAKSKQVTSDRVAVKEMLAECKAQRREQGSVSFDTTSKMLETKSESKSCSQFYHFSSLFHSS
jgi:uncharacterized protein (DUF3084 family)